MKISLTGLKVDQKWQKKVSVNVKTDQNIQSEEQRRKSIKKHEVSEKCGTPLSIPTYA